MDEKKVQELWLAFKDGNELGSLQEFKGFMSDPKNRAEFHAAFKDSAELGDINQFEDYLGVKKKVSSKGSAFDWETGSIDVQKLSSTQPTARTAGEKFKYSWGGGKTEELASAPYSTSEISAEIQDSPQTAALKNIRQRRGTDYSSSAADIAKGRIDAAGKRTSTPLESLHSAASQMSFGDWLDESPSSYNTDQRTAAEFNAFSKALSDENREIGLAIKGIESKMKLDYGTDMDDYGAMVLQFNTLQTSAKKLVDGFEKLPDNKKTQEEADRINAEIDKIQEQAAELQGRLDEFSSTPEFDEISKLYELSNINTKKYEDEIKTGKYDHAKQFGKYLEYRQSLKDEAFKKMTPFDKLVSATGSVILHTLAKVPQSVASLSDVIEKSVGMEGEKNTAGDVVQDILIGLGDDIQAAFPAPTKLQRGGLTDTAKWGDYQVDFTADGEIQAIRDKDGYLKKTMLSEQDEAEIKSLKKERKFNVQSFSFQTASTIVDVGIQILGTKGIGGIKAGVALTGGIVGDGISVGLKMAPLGTKFGATATVAGMLSNDLYNEGLANFDGPDTEEKAAKYALATGVTIGLINSVLGLGMESQLLKTNSILRTPLAGLSKNVEKAIGQRATNIAKGILGEEAEEMVLEKLGQAGVQYMMNETSGGKFDIHPYKDVSAIMSETLTTAVAGGLFGGLRKIDKAPNAMQQSLLIDGSRNIPAIVEAVRGIAEANGEPLTQEDEARLVSRLETTAAAIAMTPEEHQGDMAIVGLVSEQFEIEEENKALQEKVKRLATAFTTNERQRLEENKARIEELSVEIAARIQRKDLFSAGGSFSNILGGSGVDSVPSNQRIVNGIEFVEYTNPKSGVIDVVMSGTSDTDYVGFYRIYENGKPTNRWSSKFENQSRNKENFKTMISGVQEMLPAGHEYTEKTSISTDGLRVWNQQLSRGYELQYDENGKLVTDEVAINGDAIVNELGINVNQGNFENISVTTNEQFNKVKAALKPYLEKFGLNESNIRWESGTVMIDLPVLRSTNNTAKSKASSGSVAKEGEVLSTEPVLEPTAKKQTELPIPQQPKTFDELASLPDTDLSNMSDEQVVAKVLEEGSPAQVGQAWLVEPDVVQGEIFTKEAAIEDAVLNSTFSIEALQGTPDVSKKYLPKEGRKAQVVDLAELAEELSDQTGMNITEADIADYIRANPEKKKPKKMKANPNKRLLAQRYKDLTGKLPRVEEVEKLSERSRFLKEKQAVESEFPEAADVRPARPASDKIEKSLMNRVATDPLVPLEVREMAKAGKLDYEVLKDEHVNEVAEFEIRQNMATMDLSDGLAASVKTAKDLLKESVDTDSELSREVNGAVATSIILKVAFNYAENGMMKEAHELYDWLDSYSRGIGRSISSLRANASPEGVAGRTAVRVFETQVRELSKKGKNATLDQMLKDLRKEIEKARDGSNMKAAKETAAKVISGKKKDLKAERSEILAKIKAQIFDQSLGAVYDPEQQAEKAAQLISNVRLLIRNLVESGVTKVQEVYDNVVESLKSVGFSDDDADRVAKDALLASNGKPLGTLPSGKAQKLMEVPLSGTVSKEQIESLEPLGTLPSGQQGTLIDVPTTTKSKVPTEHVESDVKKPDMADATGPQQTIEQQTDEDGNVIDFSPKASGPMFKTQQAMIEDVVDEHYKNSDGRALWVKLKEIGLPESDARKYEQALTSELLKKEKAAIVRAVENFKQKVREEEVEGIIIHESRWNGSVDAIVAAAAKGLLNDQSLAAAVAGYFGFVSITPQDVADIKAISSNIIEGVGSNAVVGPDGDILGYQPIGIPAPTGTTLSPVNQKSPELLARAQKEMKIKLLEMEKRNEGIMPILAGELGFMMHAGALANTGTWLNVIVGTLTKLAPDLISLSVSNPVAAVRAVQEISKSKAKNWKMGWGVLRGAFKDNFSHMENEQTQLDGQYVNTVSLMEVAMIRGLSKYSKMYADATGIDKAKSFGKLVGAVLSQAYRVAIAPKAIDAQFAHPVTEFVRFIETFNKMSNGLKFAETVTPEFAKKVSEYGMFTQKAWDIAKSQAAAEVAGMKASGKKVPFDFETRRAKEIIQQQVRREEIRSAQLFMDQASLRGEMSGFLGVAYDSFMHSGVQTKRPPLLEVTRTIVRASIAMFMRVAIHGANIVQKTTPLLSPIINATSHVLVNRTLAGALSSKYVGEKVMKEYPVDRQIGNGYVRKSATENAKDFGEQAMSMFIFATLAMSMFDRDDEDNIILDPDRWIDISASLDNSPFTNEVGGMTRYSVRFRQSDGSWGKPKKFSLWLPFVAPLAIIGGLRDDIMFRNEEFQKKSPLARGGASLNDVIGVFGEVSFNSLGQTIARFGKAQSAAAKSDTPMPWVDVTFETLLRPTKAVMPGVYRDLMVNELGVMLDEPAKKPDKWYEKVAKDLPWIDYYIKGDRFDEYGNLIYRDSKLGKMVERVSMGFVDFAMKNEETRNRPEWKLSSKFESLITPGQYFPSRSLKRTSDGEEFGVKKGEKITDEVRMEMSRRVAERKGLIVNEYYEELNDMDKQSLEQMFEKIHNFAGEAIKFEMGYSKESKEPKFSFKKANKSIKESDED